MAKFNDIVLVSLCLLLARVRCWSCYADNCYMRSSTTMNWMEAVSYCGYKSSTIASIHSASENNYINFNVCGTFSGTKCWIGLTDSSHEGKFSWVDGSAVNYHMWLSGQPDNYDNEDWVEMWWDGYWNDGLWTNENHAICMKPNPTPSPTREPSYQWPTCQPTTMVPTKPPSANPTTQTPTKNPTMLPTLRPTTQPPSHSPTIVPSSGPTAVPSIDPTSYPSVSPLSPTSFPSDPPSLQPTASPSVAPTILPSVATSLLPSTQPTTLSPTIYPSEFPTSSPTENSAYTTAEYCIESVKLHFAFIVVGGCLTICALCIFMKRRLDSSGEENL